MVLNTVDMAFRKIWLNKFSLIDRKVKYKSPYGETGITMKVADVLYTHENGISIKTTNNNIYELKEIEIL
ncbi:MAG: hypothetical protein ACWA5P_02865 [bacterium]